ncbi:MAG: hypothetical protein AABZ55_04995 [Bdellovibrionota bacterium]
MELVHRSPSVGGITKKMIAINPNLSTIELIEIIRKSSKTQGFLAGEFASAEAIDEVMALRLTRAALEINKPDLR